MRPRGGPAHRLRQRRGRRGWMRGSGQRARRGLRVAVVRDRAGVGSALTDSVTGTPGRAAACSARCRRIAWESPVSREGTAAMRGRSLLRGSCYRQMIVVGVWVACVRRVVDAADEVALDAADGLLLGLATRALFGDVDRGLSSEADSWRTIFSRGDRAPIRSRQGVPGGNERQLPCRSEPSDQSSMGQPEAVRDHPPAAAIATPRGAR
jgi:hypothetical protein